jgi:hypothetical protein
VSAPFRSGDQHWLETVRHWVTVSATVGRPGRRECCCSPRRRCSSISIAVRRDLRACVARGLLSCRDGRGNVRFCKVLGGLLPRRVCRVLGTNRGLASPVSRSSIAIDCWLACKSQPTSLISASFNPSAVKWTPHSLRGSTRGPRRHDIDVHAGELEERPPGAPTIEAGRGGRSILASRWRLGRLAMRIRSRRGSATRSATRSRYASEAELQQRRHAIVETDLLCNLAV